MIEAAKLATIERHRRRIWSLCYRMTGDRAASDDLAQECLARAIERESQSEAETFEGWLYRIATTVCLDWLRKGRRRSGIVLADPLVLDEAPCSDTPNAEDSLVRRDDVRLAIVTSMQALVPRQRAVLILRDVLDRSTEETALALGLTAGNVKVLLHRARAALDEAHRVGPCDTPVDAAVVERFAAALEAGDAAAIEGLLASDVWGFVDDGDEKRRPVYGARAAARQWANAMARYEAGAIRRTKLNGELALVVALSGTALATIHLETRDGRVQSTRVVLDPPRLTRLGVEG